ncbi:glutamate receptor 2.9-like [Penaeus chinensis]|uniref:glutamate receptor 2.9-like n=1 Tax=Penaeus chinensis TaxID=139456 RepID=UPI001FB640BD|nr:glutamate receptor 2.9-like [Penaeus chinensis]
MSGLGLVMTYDRFRAVDVSEYLYLDESSAAYLRPVVGSHVEGFLRPFDLRMWMGILAMMFVTMMAISLVHFGYNCLIRSFELDESPVPSDAEDFQRKELLRVTKDSVMWTVYTLLAQSAPKVLRGDSIRLVSGLWLFGCLILASVYRSNLKAMLILPRVSVAFNSLEELVETDLPVWVATSSALHNAAANSPDDTSLGKLKHMLYSVDGPTNVSWGVSDLLAGKHVYAGPRAALVQILHSTFSQKGNCVNYIMSEGFMKTTMLNFVFPKGSPLKRKIDPLIPRLLLNALRLFPSIVRLREAGVLDLMYRRGVHNASECLRPLASRPSNEVRTLDLGDFYGVFLVYFGGMTLAALVFVAELSSG